MQVQIEKNRGRIKAALYWLWIVIVATLAITYLANPEILSADQVVGFLKAFEGEMMLAYILATFARGFFLIPSTPFVIGGGILFPDQLLMVLGISMAGVMFSASLLYYFSDALGFSKYLNENDSGQIATWKNRLQSPKATWFVLGWSFFPFVPTDLICYVAGIVKMPYQNMFIGVFLGELILDIFYIFIGWEGINLLL